MAAITAIIGTAVLLLPLWASIIVTLLVGLGYVVFAFTRFNNGHVHELRVPVAGGARSRSSAGSVLRYFGETRQRRRVTALFSQYVPEDGRATTGRRGPRVERASKANGST